MEWSRAKRFVFWLLVVFNLVIFCLNMREEQKYLMQSEYDKVMLGILQEHGISLHASLNKVEILSMKRLEAELFVDTIEQIQIESMGEIYQKESMEAGNFSYEDNDYFLYIEGSSGTFIQKNFHQAMKLHKQKEAELIAKQEMAKMESFFGELILYDTNHTERGWEMEFFSLYEEEVVFSNWFRVLIAEEGFYQLDFQYFDIAFKSEEEKEIITQAEALFAFLREWRNEERADGVIMSMKLGYHTTQQSEIQPNTKINLEPTYRIEMEGGEIYFIHANTGAVFYP